MFAFAGAPQCRMSSSCVGEPAMYLWWDVTLARNTPTPRVASKAKDGVLPDFSLALIGPTTHQCDAA